MAKKAEKPNWLLSFEVSPEPTIGHDGQTHYQATAVARRGDLAYVAELELTHWSEDIAAFFEQVRAVFFEAEVNGLPAFPEMSEEAPEKDEQHTEVEAAEAKPVSLSEAGNPEQAAEVYEEGDVEYDITFYPARAESADTSIQERLF